MKTLTLIAISILIAAFLMFLPKTANSQDEYIVIGWNDLGMHCSNQDFSNIAVLPPYNNLYAVVIKKGTSSSQPEIITDNISVNYSIPGNTYSVGKTNFWDYTFPLFGVTLEDNIGLTGAGLTGNMDIDEDAFLKEGIPITPFTDDNLLEEDPFQLALFEVYNNDSELLTTTQNVIPVSNEIGCVSTACHSSETSILYMHEEEDGFDPTDTPILCAECHSSNALGTEGHPGVPSFSYVIHDEHSEETNDCYQCHPGANAQCLRGVMYGHGMICQDCHGSVAQVALSIEQGREPWLEEPSCGATECHGSNYAEESGKLFRQSRGHSNLYCSTCHGEPHAIAPSTLDRDNVQNISLQGYAGVLQDCKVCHGVDPTSPGPHNLLPTTITEFPGNSKTIFLGQNYPNPFRSITHIPFSLSEKGRVYMSIFSLNGKNIMNIINRKMAAGNYETELNSDLLMPGTYVLVMEVKGVSQQIKIVVQ